MQEIGNIQAAASGYLADTGEYPDFANNCNDAITVLKNAPTAYLIALDPSSDKNCESDNGRGIELALVSSSGAAKIVDPGYWAAM
jgi:hypothetical protein